MRLNLHALPARARREDLLTPTAYRETLARRASENRPKGWDLKAEGDTAEVYIYDVIDPVFGVNAEEIVRDLAAIKAATITVRLNTPGGFTSDGMAIYNALTRHSAKIVTVIDAEAASMGSIIALAGDEILMADNALFMIHNPWGLCIGTAGDMSKSAAVLDKIAAQMIEIYVRKSGQGADQIKNWMDAETWFDAQEALAAGFITGILTDKPADGASGKGKDPFSRGESPAPAPAPDDTERRRARARAQLRLTESVP